MPGHFPLNRGHHGEAVRDLQRRLGAAGFEPDGAEPGFFCVITESTISAFQSQRGLHTSGSC
ncbi:MAG: peptidoglycan-binding protein, partial [Ilumatobacter sp.]|nr:peptidoglycan-binding protein [Ilumatobacter sp.]